MAVTDGAERTWCDVGFMTVAIAVFADEWVEDSTSGIAGIVQISEGVNGEISVVGTFDVSPDFGLIALGGLFEVDNTIDIGLLIWVVHDALGVNILVVPFVRVGALLDFVSIVGDEGLASTVEVVDTVAVLLGVTVGVTVGVSAIGVVAVGRTNGAKSATVRSAISGIMPVAIFSVAIVAIRSGRVSILSVSLSGDSGDKGDASRGEFHFVFIY